MIVYKIAPKGQISIFQNNNTLKIFIKYKIYNLAVDKISLVLQSQLLVISTVYRFCLVPVLRRIILALFS